MTIDTFRAHIDGSPHEFDDGVEGGTPLADATIARLVALGAQVPWRALAAVCDALEDGSWNTEASSVTQHQWAEEQYWRCRQGYAQGLRVYAARSLMCAEKLIEERTTT